MYCRLNLIKTKEIRDLYLIWNISEMGTWCTSYSEDFLFQSTCNCRNEFHPVPLRGYESPTMTTQQKPSPSLEATALSARQYLPDHCSHPRFRRKICSTLLRMTIFFTPIHGRVESRRQEEVDSRQKNVGWRNNRTKMVAEKGEEGKDINSRKTKIWTVQVLKALIRASFCWRWKTTWKISA